LIKIGLALTGLVFALIFLLSLELPLAPSDTNSGYNCYGWMCVDPYPTEHVGDWGYQAEWCEELITIEDVKVNGNTVKVLIHYNCSI